MCVACREHVHRIAKDGYLFVTWANNHYTDFALSWVHHMKMNNITNYMVGAMDDDILQTLARRSIPTFSIQAGEPLRVCRWSQWAFRTAAAAAVLP